MNCTRAAALLEALLDGELELAQRCQVEEHVEGCETCARSLSRLRKLSDRLHRPELRFEPVSG